MNFLAHSYLSGNDNEIILGNMIGDFVKGKNHLHFKDKVKQGIILHRDIDEYTDKHPIVKEAKKKLYKRYHHYSGVIVDIFYDHFLAKNWLLFSKIPLSNYAQYCYDILDRNSAIIPEKANYAFHYMKEQNWLYNYQSIEGIGRALLGMSRRTTFESGLENATEELQEDYEFHNGNFMKFFPDVIEYSKIRLKSI